MRIPMMSSINVLRITDEKPMSMAMMMPAPRRAPTMLVTYSPIWLPKMPCYSPPAPRVNMATPILAPVETPKIDGPANGF